MKTYRVVLVSGLIAGTTDILDALLFYGLRGVAPIRILQSIASGLLGPSAYKGGATTAVLGFALHYLIASTAAAIFYAVRRRVAFARKHAVTAGLIFGCAVYAFMNLIVLPLSKAGKPVFSGLPFLNGILAVVLLVGLPISLITNRYARQP